jgi:hypothetical protein
MLMYWYKFSYTRVVEVAAALKLLNIELTSSSLFEVKGDVVEIQIQANLSETEKKFLGFMGRWSVNSGCTK